MATLSFPRTKGAEGASSGAAIVERLLDAVDSAVFAVDRELRYLAYNQAHATDMRDLFGVRLALGDHVLEMIPDPDVRGNLRQALMHGLAGERFEDEYRLSAPERRASWFRVEVVPLHGPGGAVEAVAVVSRDVTEVHVSEDAAAREIQRYRALMRASMDGVHVVDRTGRVVDANPAFCKMLGRSSEEVLGMHVSAWDAQFRREELPGIITSLLDHSATFLTKHRRADGSEYAAEVSASGVWTGEDALLFCVAREVGLPHQQLPRRPEGMPPA